ncbi:Imm44 family immunity protein [Ectobacillus sp. JY-23]|uniref:Imm44 family immunity protein n=1 Tax=Ectobacillus sp. JY-23 TaxID=2933872 RepID=UPI001FF1F118|nr:Imm44 family immunity protein [Ectobacillus sp. JY-23]UOY93294.1 Imm44 family immunity protein [Ectobacillus sp. JY-23]
MEFFFSGELESDISREFMKQLAKIKKKLKKLEGNYGNEVEEIAIIPIVVKKVPGYEESDFFAERTLFFKKDKSSDLRLRISHEAFLNANDEMRKLLIIKNIIQCIRILGTKAKTDFNAKKLEDDILDMFHIDENTINKINM